MKKKKHQRISHAVGLSFEAFLVSPLNSHHLDKKKRISGCHLFPYAGDIIFSGSDSFDGYKTDRNYQIMNWDAERQFLGLINIWCDGISFVWSWRGKIRLRILYVRAFRRPFSFRKLFFHKATHVSHFFLNSILNISNNCPLKKKKPLMRLIFILFLNQSFHFCFTIYINNGLS